MCTKFSEVFCQSLKHVLTHAVKSDYFPFRSCQQRKEKSNTLQSQVVKSLRQNSVLKVDLC